MPPAGDDTLALWRESGEWWRCEPQREVRRFIDTKGIRREEETELPPLANSFQLRGDSEYTEDHREEVILRLRKIRDEKVARACGFIREVPTPTLRTNASPYAAMHLFSGYAFGRGTMLAEAIPMIAARLGIPAVLLADPFSLTGVVELSKVAKKAGIKPLVGASLEMAEGGELVLVAMNKQGYRSLSRLVSECHLSEPRLYPLCTWERLERHAEGLLCLTGGDAGPLNRLLVRRDLEGAERMLDRLIGIYGRENVFAQVERSFLPWEKAANDILLGLAERKQVCAVAGGQITHAQREDFPGQDTIVCVETLCVIDEIVGRKPRRDPSQPQLKSPPLRALNAERYLRTPEEMAELFRDRPDLVRNTLRVAERCEEDVLPKRTKLPKLYADEDGFLREQVYQGAIVRYREIKMGLKRRIDRELQIIYDLGFARHFLVAWDMCRWAGEQGIVFSGRGSVVDSVISYCLGFSRIDAFEHRLHFDRFLPADGTKRPDIDIDFEAHRREDVRGYLVRKYGERHVATVAAFGSYGSRGIVREVGKVMGLPPDSIDYLAKRLHGSVSPDRLEQAIDAKPELRDAGIPRERFHWVFRLGELLMDLPRNARAHSSGVVISADPIVDTVPMIHSAVDGVNILQWDKRSAKHFFDKFDVLCLRGNDVLAGTQERIRIQDVGFDVQNLPLDDERTYETMRSGKLIGVPQSASPAMRQAHIRLRTKDLRDASLVQAGIRPGVGGAVKINELIARRRGKPYDFAHPKLREILEHTYGLIVFQEQVDQLLQEFGGYSSGQAEEIREAIHERRRERYADSIKTAVLDRIVAQGYATSVAQEVYDLVAGFQGYGFAEGHALAFAEISIRSVWCQQNYPAEYFAALLDAQPAGYYGPCTLANEARVRGVKVLPPDVNRSGIKFLVENVQADEDPKIIVPNGGIRIALSQISGLTKETRERIVSEREGGHFRSLFDFAARVRPDRDELERLILCGAFDSIHPNRRTLLWSVAPAMRHAASCALDPGALPLTVPEPELPVETEDLPHKERAIHERSILDLDVDEHLMAFERSRIQERGGITTDQANRLQAKRKAFVVGNPIRLRFPPTASGKRVVFFDLEDETGLLNVTCFNETYLKDGHAIICSPYVTVLGEAQDRDGHTAFLAHRVFPFVPRLGGDRPITEPLPVVTSDFLCG